jgi:sulfide dehydrogenase [flavocytochrome c] flavoprotein subunit
MLPHAWKAGPQTLLLRRQLEAMDDGGLVVITAPANPFRCPPGPYERASLIAHTLKTRKPRSKLLILDGKDAFSKQRLFQAAWAALYPGLIEWVPLSMGGGVVEVDVASRTLFTDFAEHRAAVANIIPPQRAGAVAAVAGVADETARLGGAAGGDGGMARQAGVVAGVEARPQRCAARSAASAGSPCSPRASGCRRGHG